jgi:hypothetical protein
MKIEIDCGYADWQLDEAHHDLTELRALDTTAVTSIPTCGHSAD